ncbi:hypothetical protein C2G38_2037620 [Gigaspora rosea]|uniref:NUDE domain-containing protein n=1 Tax=Gigaspora rosea TaxID=44941 RepID=A0A397VC28_9GLOM|nr:hypothetical protein C2G38_2037620 [Gigaspora rosea]
MKLRWFIKENTDLKTRIEELEKNRIETTAKNAELKARVAKLEQNFEHRLEDDQCIDTNSKSLENKEINNFLDEKNKEKFPIYASFEQSQENDQDSELPEAEVNVSTEETKSGVSDSSISANSETEISMPPMSQGLPSSML